MLERIFVFIFGACVGSFLNVCIHRMPLGESLVRPRSHCPHCKKTIVWYDNIPFLSYIFLRGRCRSCGQRISFRYFFVELITAFTFLLVHQRYGLGFNFLFYLVFLCGLIVAAFVDIQHRIIPDEISVGGILAGLTLNLLKPTFLPRPYAPLPVWDAFIGTIVGGSIIYLTGFLFDLVYFKLLKHPPVEGETNSMGFGDVKLLAMMGAFLGWKHAIVIFFLAPFFGVIIGIFKLLARQEHVIPYGPFLSLAAFVSVFWADKLLGFIFFGLLR